MKRYQVRIIRTIELGANDPFEAGERAVSLAQRQKDWPENLRVEIDRLPDEIEEAHDD